jgi:SAM-dependent methyltransferase
MLRGKKHQAIRPLLSDSAIWCDANDCYNCLPRELRERYQIVETPNVSAHGYDHFAQAIVTRFRTGWVLDCGAGSRGDFFPNVVNLEVADYPSTDVLGVAEELPFRDNSFDGALCMNVLEHVRDPFKAAREIARVLKPGGELYCVAPLLQPVHGFPHHYYNMTSHGLMNLFSGLLTIDKPLLLETGLPIWSLTWMLKRWHQGLPPGERQDFREMRVGDLLGDPMEYLKRPFVTELPNDLNYELASTTGILASKPRA